MTDDKNEYLTQIYLANSDGSISRQITFSAKSNSNLQWSPDERADRIRVRPQRQAQHLNSQKTVANVLQPTGA